MVAADSPEGIRNRAHRGILPVLNGNLYVYGFTMKRPKIVRERAGWPTCTAAIKQADETARNPNVGCDIDSPFNFAVLLMLKCVLQLS
jgi:hypothetical protein